MESDNARRIKQLSGELRRAASHLLSFHTLSTSTAASDIKEQFVPGRGLLNRDPKAKETVAQGNDDEDEGSQQGSDDDDAFKLSLNGDSDSDDEATDDEDGYDHAAMMEYLNGDRVKEAIDAKHHTEQPQVNTPGLRSNIVPMDHQVVGCSIITKSLSRDSKGIVVADPPGLGKTLQVLMAIALTRSAGDGPCVVVCPPSCVAQWVDETAKFFYESSMKVIVLAGGEVISPTELFKYHLVITSYSQVLSELVRGRKFLREMKEWVPGTKPPRRPTLSLLCEVFTFSSKHLGKVLVLDEAQVIKNARGQTYAAILKLREHFDGCVMLTGTPLDNRRDAYSLFSLLRAHPIETPQTMSLAFLPQSSENEQIAASEKECFLRIVQALDAAVLRRPIETIQHMLTSVRTVVVRFILPQHELSESNRHFLRFSTTKRNKGKMSAAQRKEEKTARFDALIKATHWANHHLLTGILEFEQRTWHKGINDDDPSDIIELDEDGEKKLREWREHIEKDFNWRSPRVDVIVDTVNNHRGLRQDDAIVVMDESVLFLDILAIAFTNMYDPVQCFRYDGRMNPQQRHAVIKKFRAASGARILLASRGTGGAGLNLQCANVLIQCSAWWKVSWEEQALGCLHRAGQTRPVFYFKIEAKGPEHGSSESCRVEDFKKTKRDEKNVINMKIMKEVTRPDDAEPPKRICR